MTKLLYKYFKEPERQAKLKYLHDSQKRLRELNSEIGKYQSDIISLINKLMVNCVTNNRVLIPITIGDTGGYGSRYYVSASKTYLGLTYHVDSQASQFSKYKESKDSYRSKESFKECVLDDKEVFKQLCKKMKSSVVTILKKIKKVSDKYPIITNDHVKLESFEWVNQPNCLKSTRENSNYMTLSYNEFNVIHPNESSYSSESDLTFTDLDTISAIGNFTIAELEYDNIKNIYDKTIKNFEKAKREWETLLSELRKSLNHYLVMDEI